MIGNIIDTIVSDERWKTNNKKIKTKCISCVKKVKPQLFKYKAENYKKKDKFGSIAQELLLALPEEFKDIVKEKKEKNSDETCLSINSMKLAAVLWTCKTEIINKLEKSETEIRVEK